MEAPRRRLIRALADSASELRQRLRELLARGGDAALLGAHEAQPIDTGSSGGDEQAADVRAHAATRATPSRGSVRERVAVAWRWLSGQFRAEQGWTCDQGKTVSGRCAARL